MEHLLKIYPRAIVTDYNVTIDVFDDGDVNVCFDINNFFASYAWNRTHEDLTEKLLQSVKLIDANLDIETKIIKILKLFEKKFNKIHGFENMNRSDITILDQFKNYNKNDDEFWAILKTKYNVNTERTLKIVTYGYQFYPKLDRHILPDCDYIQVTYDVRALRTPKDKKTMDFKLLCKLRGTNLKIQQEIREAELFETIMQDIVKEIENDNINYIAICCNRGHHRSVACAEMLRYLYPNVTLNHLTIKL